MLAVAHSFLYLRDISLYVYATICLYIHQL